MAMAQCQATGIRAILSVVCFAAKSSKRLRCNSQSRDGISADAVKDRIMVNPAMLASGATMIEKILALHAGKSRVRPGEIINVRADVLMANDFSAPLAIAAFEQLGVEHVFDPTKVVFVSSHFTPARDIQ